MPLPAANQFERLRKSPGGGAFEPMLSLKEAFCWLRIGAAEKSAAILAEMKQRPDGNTVTLGGRKTTIPEGTEAASWLAQFDRSDGAGKIHALAAGLDSHGRFAGPQLLRRRAHWPLGEASLDPIANSWILILAA